MESEGYYCVNVTNDTCESSIYQKAAGSVVFVTIWPLIVLELKKFPIGRPAAALLGATLMVVLHVINQPGVYRTEGEQSNLQTIFLLIGMMILSYYFKREGLLAIISLKIFGENLALKKVLWRVCVLTAAFSAFVTNDAACLVITPLILNVSLRHIKNPKQLLPLTLGIATSANIGSAATVFGNPQNILISAKTNVTLIDFLVVDLPTSVIALMINICFLYLIFFLVFRNHQVDNEHEPILNNSSRDQEETPSTISTGKERVQNMLAHSARDYAEDKLTTSVGNITPLKERTLSEKMFMGWLIFISILLIVLLAINVPQLKKHHAYFNLGLTTAAAAVFTMLVDSVVNRKHQYDSMMKIDWTIILMFLGLFVWIEGFKNTCFPEKAFESLRPYMNLNKVEGVVTFTIFIILGSNVFSNVPLVILMLNDLNKLCGKDNECRPSFKIAPLLLAWISTIAGNLTLFGSIANLIVAEKAKQSRGKYNLSFCQYLPYGMISTILITIITVPIVYGLGIATSY